MKNFAYARPEHLDDALKLLAKGGDSAVLAGGTTMVDLMKLGVLEPAALVDITGINELEFVDISDESIRFGALARMQDVADNPVVSSICPALTESLWMAASPQLRHVARLGGNIMQRTRCPYFRETHYACNKRQPGSGCAALEGGKTDLHALIGGSQNCVAMYPGDWAQALIAFDATVNIASAAGSRQINFADFHTLPADSPEKETVLEPGEIITEIQVPRLPAMRASHYLKARDRDSYAFATVSAAVGIALDGDRLEDVRIALGGVASIPWRAREAETFLKEGVLNEGRAREAGRIAFSQAEELHGLAYKIDLGASVVAGALITAHKRALQEQ